MQNLRACTYNALLPILHHGDVRRTPAGSFQPRNQLHTPLKGAPRELYARNRAVRELRDGINAHSTRATAMASSGLSIASLANAEVLSLDACVAAAEGSPGVYAVMDSNDELQYIGMSKNIGASLERHRLSLPERCFGAKALALPQASSKAELQQSWKVR